MFPNRISLNEVLGIAIGVFLAAVLIGGFIFLKVRPSLSQAPLILSPEDVQAARERVEARHSTAPRGLEMAEEQPAPAPARVNGRVSAVATDVSSVGENALGTADSPSAPRMAFAPPQEPAPAAKPEAAPQAPPEVAASAPVPPPEATPAGTSETPAAPIPQARPDTTARQPQASAPPPAKAAAKIGPPAQIARAERKLVGEGQTQATATTPPTEKPKPAAGTTMAPARAERVASLPAAKTPPPAEPRPMPSTSPAPKPVPSVADAKPAPRKAAPAQVAALTSSAAPTPQLEEAAAPATMPASSSAPEPAAPSAAPTRQVATAEVPPAQGAPVASTPPSQAPTAASTPTGQQVSGAPASALSAVAPTPAIAPTSPSDVHVIITYPVSVTGAGDTASKLASALRGRGILRVDMNPVAYGISISQVKFFHSPDEEAAISISRVVSGSTEPPRAPIAFRMTDLSTAASAAEPGRVEVWVSGFDAQRPSMPMNTFTAPGAADGAMDASPSVDSSASAPTPTPAN